ncbi:MAG: DUF2949 domain-containing protein [Chroococcidiopsidaceae cyanobacterium CP_BM_ER_R8_30]|nr:DUF2949 domain-containing protein [Chroococcidiopsidaceae cyanobacterium CP_BM_ER_R8_30]
MKSTLLTSFLQSELGIPTAWISLAQQQGEADPDLLPMILWQYGMLTLSQLERVFDWLETFTLPCVE